jgi:hypothetical protein
MSTELGFEPLSTSWKILGIATFIRNPTTTCLLNVQKGIIALGGRTDCFGKGTRGNRSRIVEEFPSH